jgi:hypothetical protein
MFEDTKGAIRKILLGLLRRNLQIKNEQTKSMVYKSLNTAQPSGHQTVKNRKLK